MQFYNRLNFLMEVTKTTNSALARYISLDPSYVSRLRTGKRLMPKNANIIDSIASYLARNCKEEYQKKTIRDFLELNEFPNNITSLKTILFNWLLFTKGELSGEFGQDTDQNEIKKTNLFIKNDHPNISIFYGIEGKRQAIIQLLNDVLSIKTPKTLLFFSDEETSWMNENPIFTNKFSVLMKEVLEKGHTIKIIHNVHRDLDEMISALKQWVPLYLLGHIKPYFYPKKRDGIFKKTLFIVPGISALVSNSISSQIDHAANLLLHDQFAISSYEKEFLTYLNMCKPLLNIIKPNNRLICLSMIVSVEAERRNVLIQTNSLSLATMPLKCFEQILLRHNMYRPNLVTLHERRIKRFMHLVNNFYYDEIISLPEPMELMKGQIRLAHSELYYGKILYYTVEEYIMHLKNIISFLGLYKKFRIHFIDEKMKMNFEVYLKEDFCVLISKSANSSDIIEIKENNILAALWDLLRDMLYDKTLAHFDTIKAIEKLLKFMHSLIK